MGIKMKLEEITADNIGQLSEKELYHMHSRAEQLSEATNSWREAFSKNVVGVHNPIEKNHFADAYDIICTEMQKRGILLKKSDLLMCRFRKKMWGFDMTNLRPLTLAKNVISLTGQFVRNPMSSENIDVLISESTINNQEDIEKRLAEMLVDETDKNIIINKEFDSTSCVPLYDLVLVPKSEIEITKMEVSGVEEDDELTDEELKKELEDDEDSINIDLVDISKPYPKEHAARQLPPANFDSFARQNDKFGKGIHVIWGTKAGKTKVQSIRFSAEKFTTAQANKWLKEHKYKKVTEAAKKIEKSEKIGFIKSEDLHICGGLVYTVSKDSSDVDLQGDFVDDANEIWKAMEAFALKGMPIKFQHQGNPISAVVIEQFQAEEDLRKGGDIVPAGAWYLTVKVLDNKIWNDIKAGRISGFSMAGVGHGEIIEE